MIKKFNKNPKVEKFTNMLGIAVRLIVIDPLLGWGGSPTPSPLHILQTYFGSEIRQ